jgi:carbon monoxide dehydrogenase subunit G
MGSVVREVIIDAAPADVWAVISDFVGGPVRMSAGMLVDCSLVEPDVRALTFADGNVARERLIARDEPARRMVWGWVGDGVVHDNTSMQVFGEGDGRTRLVWIHDTLPDELTGWLAATMDKMVPGIQQALKTTS